MNFHLQLNKVCFRFNPNFEITPVCKSITYECICSKTGSDPTKVSSNCGWFGTHEETLKHSCFLLKKQFKYVQKLTEKQREIDQQAKRLKEAKLLKAKTFVNVEQLDLKKCLEEIKNALK